MQRRQLLLGAVPLASGVAGCPEAVRSGGSLRAVTVELTNGGDRARTFHIALEAERGMLGWEPHRVDAGSNEEAAIRPDEDITPVALHGAVGDFSGRVDALGVNELSEDYCLQFRFRVLRDVDPPVEMSFVADTEC